MNRSPSALFVLPGTTALAAGLLACSFVLARIEVLGREWDVHALIAGALVAIVGSQLVSLGVCTQAYACYFVGAESAWFERARRHLSLEHGLLLGATLTLAGSLTLGGIGLAWIGSGFGALGGERLAICAASVVVIGVQTIFYSFMLSVLGLRREQ